MSSSFLTPLVVEVLPNEKFKLTEDFTYYTDIKCDHCIEDHLEITVPAGFVTDLASIPRPLWAIFPPHGKYGKAAVLHDYMYDNALHSKKWADKIFYEAMRVLGVGRIKSRIMYFAVKIFGRGNY